MRSSPETLEIGRTVGRTCSWIGTSLTVYFSRVVIFPIELELVEALAPGATSDEVVVVAGGFSGGGVEDCARNPAHRAQAAQRRAGPFKADILFVRYIISVVFLRLVGPSTRYATPLRGTLDSLIP